MTDQFLHELDRFLSHQVANDWRQHYGRAYGHYLVRWGIVLPPTPEGCCELEHTWPAPRRQAAGRLRFRINQLWDHHQGRDETCHS